MGNITITFAIDHALAIEVTPSTKGDQKLAGTTAEASELSKAALIDLVQKLQAMCLQLKAERNASDRAATKIQRNATPVKNSRGQVLQEIYQPASREQAMVFLTTKVGSSSEFINGQLLADVLQRKVSKQTAAVTEFRFTQPGQMVITFNLAWFAKHEAKGTYMLEKLEEILLADCWELHYRAVGTLAVKMIVHKDEV